MVKPLLLAVLMLVLAASIACAVSPENFMYSAEIKGPVEGGKLYRVTLTDEILRNCETACRDLRVLGAQGNEIPYVILKDERQQKIQTYQLETISFEDDDAGATLTLRMPEGSKDISVIALDIDGKNFKKRISLSCGNDLKEWSPVTEGNIYDFSSQVDLRKTDISFNERKCLYYRLRLADDKPRVKLNESFEIRYKELKLNLDTVAGGTLRISRITGRTSEGSTAKIYDRTEFDELSSHIDERGNTVVVLEAGLPFNQMTLKVKDRYFYRTVELYYSDTGAEGPFKFMTRMAIYSFPLSGTQETKTAIECNSENHSHYKIVIKNDDNPPLSVEGVTLSRIRRNLFFVALVNSDMYGLYFGSPKLDKLNYDLTKFVRQDNWFENDSEALELSAIKTNADYMEPIDMDTQARVEKTVLLVIVIGLVIAIGYWIYVLVRKTSRSDR